MKRTERDADLREELESHIEFAAAEYVRRGATPAEARRRALAESGGIQQAVEAVRERRRTAWMEHVVRDAGYALRSLARRTSFTVSLVTMLAVGTGVLAAAGSAAYVIVFRALPYGAGDALLHLRHVSEPGHDGVMFSVPEVEELRARIAAVVRIATYSPWPITVTTPRGAVRMQAALVDGAYFETLGHAPLIGRTVGAVDDRPQAPPVAVLGRRFWLAEYAGDPSIVGRSILVDGLPVAVIGVVPDAPVYPYPADLYANASISSHHASAQMELGWTHRMSEVIARLRPGTTAAAARSAITSAHSEMVAAHPDAYESRGSWSIVVQPLREAMATRARPALLAVGLGALLLFLVTAANAGNLALVRSAARGGELAVRMAFGATPGRIRGQLFVENLLVAAPTAVVSGLVCAGSLSQLADLLSRYTPRAAELRFEPSTMLAVAFLLAVLTCALTLLVPLAEARGLEVGGRGPPVSGASRALVSLQVALAVLLLGGAAVLGRALQRIEELDRGYDGDRIVAVSVPLLTPEMVVDPSAAAEGRARYAALADSLRHLDGVVKVGLGAPAPLQRAGFSSGVEAQVPARNLLESRTTAELRIADTAFFSAARVRMLAGRDFNGGDSLGGPPVAIVNAALALRLFGDRPAVGARIRLVGDELRFTPFNRAWMKVVGVCEGNGGDATDTLPVSAVYLPFAQAPPLGGVLVVRTDVRAGELLERIGSVLERMAPDSPVGQLETLTMYRARQREPERLNAALTGAWAVIALIIAVTGVASVQMMSTRARRREIGIRMAMGATPTVIGWMFLVQGLRLVGIGLTAGFVAALVLARPFSELVVRATPDAPMVIGAGVVVAASGLVAAWIPARQAARIDPVEAMR